MAVIKVSCNYCHKIHDELYKCTEKLTLEKKRNKEKNERYADETKFLKSAAWRKFRKTIISRDGGYCQRCFIKYNIINSESLEVHHIKPRSKYNGKTGYPDLRLERTNCITMCKSCNTSIGIAEELDFKVDLNEDEYYFTL